MTFDWWVEANPDLYYAETTRSAIPDESADNFIIPIFYPLPEHYDWKQERFPCYPTSVEFKPDQSRHRRGQYAESHRHRQRPDLLRLLR